MPYGYLAAGCSTRNSLFSLATDIALRSPSRRRRKCVFQTTASAVSLRELKKYTFGYGVREVRPDTRDFLSTRLWGVLADSVRRLVDHESSSACRSELKFSSSYYG